jgi:phage shock protein PspC (stress-responsive transcriptional regulator)
MTCDNKVLTRSNKGLITGTLTGLAEHFGLNKSKLQLVFVILAFMGVGFMVYFILWISIPSYNQRADLLEDLINKKNNEQ